MAGLYDTDIKLDAAWQLTRAATGDAPVAAGFDCLMQDIRLEAISQEGELFYDAAWGWSLIDFAQSEYDELTAVELKERVRTKLERRDVIDPQSIQISLASSGDVITVLARFRFTDDSADQTVSISIDRINVEVTAVD